MSSSVTGTVRRGARLSLGDLVVVSEPSLPSFPFLPFDSSALFLEIAIMSGWLSASSPPRWPRLLLLSLLLLGATPGPRLGAAFYLPGLAPVNFCEEEKKSDECKVGEALWTSECPVGRGNFPLQKSWGSRGRGRSSGWSQMSPVALGLVLAEDLRLWNGPCRGLDSGGLWASGSSPVWRTRLHQLLYSVFLEQGPCIYDVPLELDACMSAASVPRVRVYAHSPVSRTPSEWKTRSFSNFCSVASCFILLYENSSLVMRACSF